MSSSVKPSLRVTSWPEEPLPEVELKVFPTRLDRGRLVPSEPEPEPSWQVLPAEWALRELARLNVDDEDVVIELANTRGRLDRRFTAKVRHRSLRPAASDQPPGIDDARLWLHAARAVLEHAVALRTDAEPTTAWTNEGFTRIDEVTAEDTFVLLINLGLAAFPPRIELAFAAEIETRQFPGGERRAHTARSHLGRPEPHLFDAVCLQVFNLLLDPMPISTCENERCGRRFLRHQGRSKSTDKARKHGSVRYCSDRCTRAVAQRNLRARRRDESSDPEARES